MRGFTKTTLMVIAMTLVTTVVACQSSEERAEDHFQSAMALLEEGDTARATIEFRNVFQNNGLHREARQTFAAMLRDIGETQQSYSQYLRLVEQYPDDVEGRIALSEMAIEFQNWEEVRRHGGRAVELAPDDPATEIIAINIAYADALEAEDPAARRQVADRALERLRDEPDNMLLQRLMIDNLIRDGDLETALVRLEALNADRPDDREIYDARLGLLAQLERREEVDALLREMIALFPEDDELSNTFLRFLLALGETDEAEAFLRAMINNAQEGTERRSELLIALVRLRLEVDGPHAAIEELDRIIAAEPGTAITFRTLRASLQFETGETAIAIAELQGVVEEDGLTLNETGQVRVVLAQMLLAEGNSVGARRLVEEVLETDGSQAEALKMLAAWLIEEDQADRAIARLRIALDTNPGDAEALTLMAHAHSRNGNRELANEFLSLAVEASGAAPEETLRYAQALVAQNRYRPAEEILIDALRLIPGELSLLIALGDIYLQTEDWPRAEQVERTLRGLEDPVATAQANDLHSRILEAQGRTDEAVDFLEGLVEEGSDANLRVHFALIGARVANGDTEDALSYINDLLEASPDDLALRLALAAVQNAIGLLEEAEANFRQVVEAEPLFQQAWIGLIRVLNAQGEDDAATETLDAALAVLPDAPDLLWVQASYLERSGDFEGAITIYEQLYELLPNSPIVANNLASLISTYRDDGESLERAYNIARRLRGSDVASFQDTYGWIAYRRGDLDEALAHLEPAAEGLAEDPLVQYHLGMTYLALDRIDDALAQLQRAVEIAGPDDERAQFDIARTEIAALEATAAAAEGAEEE